MLKQKEKKKKGIKVIRANKTTETTTEATTENKIEENEATYDASGDGWYLLNGVLHISKIYYRVYYSVLDGYCVDYETPWTEYENQITNIIINADLSYKGDEGTLLDDYKEILAEDKTVKEETLLFANMDSLKSVTITRLKLDQMTDVSGMFANNENLTNVNIDGFDMSGIKNASYMFANNPSLYTINLQKINTSAFVTVAGMFQGCTNLSSVSVSAWNTSNIKDFSHLFENCKSLASIDLSGWSIVDADVTAMFENCDVLSNVELTNVSLENTIAVNSMFNENNSIASYEFAEKWNIYTEKDKCIFLIGDDCYHAIPILVMNEKGSTIIEYVYYKKTMPTWYKESVEFVQSIDEDDKIFSSPRLDVYVYATQGEDVEPPTLTDVVDRMCNALAQIDPETEDETSLLNNLLKKLDLLKKLKDKEFEDEDLKELLELSMEEIEALIAEE